MNSQVTITKRLKQLSGTALIFDVEAPNGVTGSIQIKANPVKKNISEVTWNIPAHQFNGKTDLISNWLQSTVSLVQARFSS